MLLAGFEVGEVEVFDRDGLHTGGFDPVRQASEGVAQLRVAVGGGARTGRGGTSVISCLTPEQFLGTTRGTTASFRTSYPRALQQHVIDNWGAYGYR